MQRCTVKCGCSYILYISAVYTRVTKFLYTMSLLKKHTLTFTLWSGSHIVTDIIDTGTFSNNIKVYTEDRKPA